MSNKQVLVIGAAGEVGEGIVRQLLADGNRVVAQSRSKERLDRLADLLGQPDGLTFAVGDADSPSPATLEQLDSVVASIGSWWSGPNLIDLDPKIYEEVMRERLTSHFLAARAFLPGLLDRPGSSYVMIHGGSGFVPIPGSGPVSIAGAGQVMLKDVLAAELKDHPVRINLLSMMSNIATRSFPTDDSNAITADDVGRFVAYLVSDRAADVRGKTIKFTHRREIPG